MDLRDGHLVCLFCLVVSTSYSFHCIRVLHDKLEHKSSTIERLKQVQDDIVKEAEQQKFKLDDLRTKISINTDDNLKLQENILSNHHNIKAFDETLVDLRRNLSSLQNIVESNVGYITVMRRHEMQIDKSIIRTKTENKQQIKDLNETIARLQSELNGVKETHVDTKAHMNQSIMLFQKNMSSLQNKVDLYGVTIMEMQRHELQTDKSIIKMKTENIEQIEDMKKNIAGLQSDYNSVRYAHVETKEQLIQTKMILRNDLLSLQNKVESTEVNIKAIEKDKLQRERTILEMKTENMRDLKLISARLQFDHNGVNEKFEEIKKHHKDHKDVLGQIIDQIADYVYYAIELIYNIIDKLEVHLHDTNILLIIRKGLSILTELGLKYSLGNIAVDIE